MVFQNEILAGASGSIPTYQIDQSLRLKAASSQYLSRTFAADDGDTWTLSMWLKRGALSRGTNQCIYGVTGYSTGHLFLNSSELMQVNDDGAYAYNSTQVFRDPSAWSHYLFRSNGTASSAFYNGELITFPSAYNLNQYNRNVLHYLFRAAAPHYFDGYAAEVAFVSDQYLAYTDFTEFSTDGPLVPKALSDIDFSSGTNSYYLKFENSGDLGEDTSGNNNDWTVNNSPVQVTDTPTLNYTTLNPLTNNNSTLSDGNTVRTGGQDYSVGTTIGFPASGIWQLDMEVVTTSGGGSLAFGVALESTFKHKTADASYGDGWTWATAFSYNADGTKTNEGTNSAYGANYFTNGKVVSLIFNADVGALYAAVDGSLQNSATGAEITAGTTTNAMTTGLTAGIYVPFIWSGNNAIVSQLHSGSGDSLQAISGVAPKALNTANLPAPTITDGSTAFQTTLYTGDGNQTQTLTQGGNSTFNPDFIWIKNRTAAYSHNLNDAVRGYTGASPSTAADVKVLASDNADNEGLSSVTTAQQRGFVQESTANGFIVNKGTAGSQDGYYTNRSSQTYAAWQWKANGAGSSNTDGSINTTATSVNTTAGISISTYTGNATSGATIGHGLGVAPDVIIVKNRDAADAWQVYHSGVASDPATDYLVLNTTAASVDNVNRWNDTAPTSSVFSLGNAVEVNTNTEDYVAYCFAEVEGFSKFGGYTGNGSTDGPFIFTGFRPAFWIVKRTNSTGHWTMFDSTRDPYNLVQHQLEPNYTSAEATASTKGGDFLSNGWKVRSTQTEVNASGSTYIYMAFAENPFGGDGVAPATAR